MNTFQLSTAFNKLFRLYLWSLECAQPVQVFDLSLFLYVQIRNAQQAELL